MRKMLMIAGLLCVLGVAPNLAPQARRSLRDLRPATHSGPIAVTPDDHFVWVVNPDNDNVAKIDVSGDENRVVAHVKVGDLPQNVAITPDGKYVYVSNTGSGTVSVIKAKLIWFVVAVAVFLGLYLATHKKLKTLATA